MLTVVISSGMAKIAPEGHGLQEHFRQDDGGPD